MTSRNSAALLEGIGIEMLGRRSFLATTASLAAGLWSAPRVFANDEKNEPALIAITLDLEMSRNYPTKDQTHWDYEKGNLNAETKQYAVEAARRVRQQGGILHCFAVGRVFEQEHVDWMKDIAAAGHPIGNHTYDHVNVLATRPEDIQFRFQRSPWLIEGRTPAEVIAENIRLCTLAMKDRIGTAPDGFRTPGGFNTGLKGREDIQKMLLDQGFTWVSSLYPAHLNAFEGGKVRDEVFGSIVEAQRRAQPFVYPTGLVEVPMSPISDVSAFRSAGWDLPSFLEAIRRGVTWAIDNRAVFDFLAHPSCLYVTDPDFKALELICKLVKEAGDRAKIVDLGTIARRVSQK
ncbi:MAG TPA: polysaccharide deacetylase family protein [Planctomycetaceae bacterium]|nr:polysaccharide deacetylase family protein [Planctomycetaceae bacterium]